MTPKQQTLEGFENPKDVPEIDDAIEEYQDLKEKRIKLLAKELEAKEGVHSLMKQHKLKIYYHEDLCCEIVAGEEAVKVKRLKPKKAKDDEE